MTILYLVAMNLILKILTLRILIIFKKSADIYLECKVLVLTITGLETI